MDDRDYIQQFQNGDSEAFAYLYDKYVQKIYSFIFHKTMHKETAEDLTSQTFMKALEKMHTYQDQKSQFQTWVFTIARNTVYDFFRTQKTESDIDDVWDLDSGDDIEELVDTKLHYKNLHTKLQRLSADQRDILMMRFWQDMTYKEIGDILGKTEGSVKMSCLRSIKKLKQDFVLFLLIPFFL